MEPERRYALDALLDALGMPFDESVQVPDEQLDEIFSLLTLEQEREAELDGHGRPLPRAVRGMKRDLEPGCGCSLDRSTQRGLIALGVAVVGILLAHEEETGGEAAMPALGRDELVQGVRGIAAGNRIEQERASLAKTPRGSAHDPAAQLAYSGCDTARTEKVDVVRKRDEEAFAAWIPSPLHAEPPPEIARQESHPRPGRMGGRTRPPVLVAFGVALWGERQQTEHLLELLGPRRLARTLVEGEAERVEERVERVLGLRGHYFRGRSAGKRITSRIASRPVNTIASRSMPSPSPPVGGIP